MKLFVFFTNCYCSILDKAVIHIVGYGLLSVGTSKLLLQALENQKFNVIILDESHYLKTRNAARTKRLHHLCTKAKHAILLSGTPSLARPREVCDWCNLACHPWLLTPSLDVCCIHTRMSYIGITCVNRKSGNLICPYDWSVYIGPSCGTLSTWLHETLYSC